MFCLFVEKKQNRIYLASIIPVTISRELVPSFRYPLVTLKVFRKATFDPENCS
jgi:hypothetical protein